MRVLGIDCGTERTGWGVISSDGRIHRVVAHGLIRTAARDPLEIRLREIASGLRAILEQHQPDAAGGWEPAAQKHLPLRDLRARFPAAEKPFEKVPRSVFDEDPGDLAKSSQPFKPVDSSGDFHLVSLSEALLTRSGQGDPRPFQVCGLAI